jgi:hypothetical protein
MRGRRPGKTGGVFAAWSQTFNATDMSAMYHAKRRGRNRVELYNEECASTNQPR